jgi:DNA-directed RNA polymerase I, II, and III subunit RPABC2
MAPKSINKTVKIVEEKVSPQKKDDKKKIIGKGLEVKDNPDKIDKKDFDSNEEEEIDEDEIEDENEEEIEDEEEVEEVEEAEEKDKGDDEEEAQGGDDECVYKITKKKKIVDIELDAVVEDTFEDEEPKPTNDTKYVKSEDRITKSYLYEFERVRLLGERAKQISMGAKPMIKNVDKLDPKSIARLEIENKVIPLMILRELPDGRIEKWKINELQ